MKNIIPRLQNGDTGISPFFIGCEELFFKWFNDPRIYLHMGDLDQFPVSFEDAKKYVESHKKDTWLIIAKQDSEWVPIGYIGMFIRTRHMIGILRYAIGEIEFIGKGHASRAVSTFLNWAFKESNLESVHASVSGINKESSRLLKKIGFKFIGEHLNARFENGQRYNELLFEMLKIDYYKIYEKV